LAVNDVDTGMLSSEPQCLGLFQAVREWLTKPKTYIVSALTSGPPETATVGFLWRFLLTKSQLEEKWMRYWLLLR